MQNAAELLEAFRTAVSNREYDEAKSVVTELAATYEEARPVEKARRQMSTTARSRAGQSSDERDVLHEHVRQATATQLTRAGFLTEAATFLAAPDRGDAETVVETASTLERRERRLDEAAAEATDVLDDGSLPPTLSVIAHLAIDSVRLNESVALTVAVGNVGGAPAENVEVELDVDEGLSVETNTIPLGTVRSNAVQSATVEVTGNRTGDHAIALSVTSDDAESNRDRVTVTVRGERSDRLRTLRVAKGDTKSGHGIFGVTVDGEIRPSENAEPVAEDGSAVDWVGPERGVDSLQYSGEIRTFLLKGTAEVYVDGERVEPASLGSPPSESASSFPNTLTVTKEGAAEGFAAFMVTASSGVRAGEDSEAVVRGRSALDALGPQRGSDTVYYAGNLTRFLLKGPAVVRVNGRRVDPDRL